MRELMIRAHKITKEIVQQYEVDYRTQLGITLSYLMTEKRELANLEGSEKQIAWATDIRKELYEASVKLYDAIAKEEIKNKKLKEVMTTQVVEMIKYLESEKSSKVFIDNYKDITAYKTSKYAYKQKNTVIQNLLEELCENVCTTSRAMFSRVSVKTFDQFEQVKELEKEKR